MTAGKAPLLGGDFSGPENNAPRKEEFALPSVENELTKKKDTQEEGVGDEAKEDMEGPSPQEEYHKGLKEAGIALSEAREIMAEILVNDVYRETHHVGPKGHEVTCVLRSRTYADIQRAYRYLEAEKPTYPAAMNDFMATYNVAASLEQFAGKTFSFPDSVKDPDKADEAFQERLNFLKGKNSFLLSKITDLVAKMDGKLMAVFAEGAPEDF